ncbi:MAG: nitrophenyl compound nitroreductase subunit ArsF family protein [Marinifilaceae bacterium]
MKKIISFLSLVLLVGATAVSAQCCSGKSAQNTKKQKASCCSSVQKTSEVKAYYFHATRRCATCMAVEDVSKAAIQENFGKKVSFESINVEKESDLVKKYKITGQTLLIVHGDRSVNLTNTAFLNARTNPDKLKSKIKSTIESML